MGIVPLPQTCREYLGQDRGTCPRRAVVEAADGREFCQEHADERAAFLEATLKGRS